MNEPLHNDLAEQSTLGGMLLSQDATAEVIQLIKGTDFYKPAHELIFNTIRDLYERGEPADAVTVSAELTQRGELGRAGGAPYLHTLMSTVPTAANAGYYAAQIVAPLARKRQAQDTAKRIYQAMNETAPDDLDDVLQRLTAELSDAARPVTPQTSHKDAIDRFPSLNWDDVFTCDFTAVDWLPGRFLERGQQIAIVGEGKVGKSIFIAEWAYCAVTGGRFLGDTHREPIRVLYFDKENSLRDVTTRMRSFGATPADLKNLDYRLFPAFSGALDTSETAARELLEIVDQTQPDVVILDTVSRFTDGKENDSDTWLSLYRRVHSELKARGVACIRLDHMGKDAERGSRGSSAKSQDVDVVWEFTRAAEPEYRHDPIQGIETVTTRLKMTRTHTRSGLGDDLIWITRIAQQEKDENGVRGQWVPGRTRHSKSEDAGASKYNSSTEEYVDALIAAGVPDGLGRDRLKDWAAGHGVKLPGRITAIADVCAALKARQPT